MSPHPGERRGASGVGKHWFEQPGMGVATGLGHPVKISETPAGIRRHAPRLGEHTREILMEAGCGAADVEAMMAEGAVH